MINLYLDWTFLIYDKQFKMIQDKTKTQKHSTIIKRSCSLCVLYMQSISFFLTPVGCREEKTFFYQMQSTSQKWH